MSVCRLSQTSSAIAVRPSGKMSLRAVRENAANVVNMAIAYPGDRVHKPSGPVDKPSGPVDEPSGRTVGGNRSRSPGARHVRLGA